MQRRFLVIGAVLIGLVGMIFLVTKVFSGSTKNDTTGGNETSIDISQPAGCRAKNPDLSIGSKDQQRIYQTAVKYPTKAPSGSAVEVRMNAYDGKVATGSILYDTDFGAFNFVAAKTTVSATKETYWKVTAFQSCRR